VEAGHGDGQLDASAFRHALTVLTDGKGHYLAVVTFAGANKDTKVGTHLFYGDGVRFHAQRSSGGSSSTSDRRFSRYFWEPRNLKRHGGILTGSGDTYTVQCDDRKVDLKPLEAAPQKAMLEAASFFPALWKRHAYVLARDDEGTYLYVDRAREPPDSFDFRLFRGPRGNLKPLALVNIVSDSEGDIFASKRGRLRLVLTRSRGAEERRWQWIAGKKRVDLIDVPVDRNAQLIYRDLGVYDGQRLGTPCDDL